MPHVTHEPIDLAALLAGLQAPHRGGTAIFLGTVRSGPEDGPVVRIEYTAYEAMLEEEFAAIIRQAATRWRDVAVAGQHRLGPVAAGEASIAVAAAAPHRREAFDACRYVIEEAKERLPVWKRETLEDGSVAWRDNSGARVPSEG